MQSKEHHGQARAGRGPIEPATLVALLRRRAEQRAAATAYTFLRGEAGEARSISYGELDRGARALAARLRGVAGAVAGERALVLVPPGLDYIVAFFGCLYAGLVAVPVPPPQRARALPRLLAIVRDCRPLLALTTEGTAAVVRDAARAPELAALGALPWVVLGEASPGAADGWAPPPVTADDVAFFQYTSGSTGAPKGVALTHGNLLHNQGLIQHAFGHTEETVMVSWLPPYHDMGLIGTILQPLYLGVPCVQMAPEDFLASPLRWLSAISRYRGTTSGGPNFAYELCVRETTPEQRARLDLSSWAVAFNGAEPVRASTLARFAAAFADSGFRPSAFYPCYGLAEATLFVSGGLPEAAPEVTHV
ncbi:MAG TPA: AMP-binding protein, partial [Polyangiaceae bacterium]|nr:AMP-binding protein [Polyangiaceae bacterium]